jgi:outer membrane translocation and assembly module TamA
MDGRNNILDPRKGYFSSVSADYGAKALGSEFDFSRVFTQQYAYIPVPLGIVAASGVRFERATGGGQSFLATERLSFGGPTTIRGYERDRVDLLDLFAAVGATTDVLILNQELRFPIWGDLRGVGFVDFGKLAAHFEDVRGTETRLGAGLGLRYSTPVGVLRVDLGFPLRGSDKKGKLYFGLGQAF